MYIGNTPTTQSFISGTDYFSGNSSTVAFTLSRTVNSVNDIEAVVNNVVQQPSTAYTVLGTTLTFTSAPSSGTNNIYVRYLSTTTQSITPAQGTVNNSSFGNVTAIPFVAGPSLGAGNASIMKNRIINGAMVIDQRNAGAAITNAASGSGYPVDRFNSDNGTDGAYTAQQVSDAPVGFNYSVKITVTTADASLAAGQYSNFFQSIEGYNLADLNWGTANAKTITLSFWVKSSLTGTFGGALRGASSTRSYPFTYTISSANTWEQKSVTIVGCPDGTWLTTNGTGVQVFFGLGVGSTFSGTAGAWASASYRSATGATNILATLSATWQITGVQLEVGSSATGFEYVNYQTSLANCQRYYSKTFDVGTAPAQNLNIYAGATAVLVGGTSFVGNALLSWKYPVSMRATPTITVYTTGTNASFPSCIYDGGGTYAGATVISTGQNATNLYNSGQANTANSFAYAQLSASAEL